jgi:iron complex transport system ATP-binding protein
VLTEKPDVQQMTVMELVEMGRAPYTGFWGRLNEDDRKVCNEAIALIGIEPLKDRMIQTLSDGERQKVMIAKALAQQTPVIFLDEPTAFLDYPSKVDMLLLLSRISREAQKTIFLSTHDLELALQVADTIWLMDKSGKRKVESGKRKEKGAEDAEKKGPAERKEIAEKGATLQIGTPHELAQNGALGQFIERGNGIEFNKDTLSVRVKKIL